jgi:tRNA-Thr(GGU) m(6)t(6)A37 methyltransferase TsaA
MERQEFSVRVIGVVSSPIKHPADAPPQGDEGGPNATIRLAHHINAAAADLKPGDRVLLLTWLHVARRDVLLQHPRGDLTRPALGVFSTRGPHRPNPIGLHEVEITEVGDDQIVVAGLEAIDGTPVIDIKPVLGEPTTR